MRSEVTRERIEQVDALRFDALAVEPADRGDVSQPETEQPLDTAAAGADQITASEIAERRTVMFDPTAGAPRSSGRKLKVREVTKGLMKIAWETMDELPKDVIDALSSAFGNFDRVVGCGWLLADAVDLSIDRAVAHAVGLKAHTQTGKLKTKIYEQRKEPVLAARKLEDGDPKQQQLLAEADHREAALLREIIELPFSKAPAQQAGSSATGSRKRALEPTVTPLQRRTAEAEAAYVRAEKDLQSPRAGGCAEEIRDARAGLG